MLCLLVFIVYPLVVFSGHASCNMTLTVRNTTTSTLNDALVKMVQSRTGYDSGTCAYANLGNEFCGYSVVTTNSDFDHFQHETPVHHYVDDIEFWNFQQNNNDVVVDSGSKSEPNSFYDYGMFIYIHIFTH